MPRPKSDKVTRFSVSLPESLLDELDEMVQRRGYASRSQAVAASQTSPAVHDQPLTPFRWLLLLGFPPDVAAHIMAPEVFSADGV